MNYSIPPIAMPAVTLLLPDMTLIMITHAAMAELLGGFRVGSAFAVFFVTFAIKPLGY